MTLEHALARLEALGSERMRAQNSKHGADDHQFGVRLGDIRKVAAEIRTDHELGLALWKTGNLDARLLAILVLDPKRLAPLNACLAGIGIHHPTHRRRAIALGESMGIYRDYPVSKGCTSPFAPIWIAEMVRRQG